jgi:hypothetical protein
LLLAAIGIGHVEAVLADADYRQDKTGEDRKGKDE